MEKVLGPRNPGLDKARNRRDEEFLDWDDENNLALLTAEQEVALAQTIEVGLYAQQLLAPESVPDRENDRVEIAENAKRYDSEELKVLAELGRSAMRRFVVANIGLAKSIALPNEGKGLEMDDLIEAGIQGIHHSIEKFDFTEGFKFSTYADKWVRQAIQRALAYHAKTVKIPAKVHENIVTMRVAAGRLSKQLGRDPEAHEVAAAMDIPVETVLTLQEVDQEVWSLDVPHIDERTGSVVMTMDELMVQASEDGSISEPLYQDLLAVRLRGALHRLDDMQAEVIARSFGLDSYEKISLEDLAEKLGVSRYAITKVRDTAIARLGGLAELQEMATIDIAPARPKK